MKTALITCYFNFANYASHLAKYNTFVSKLDSPVPLYTAELAFGDRPFVLAGPNVRQFRSNTALWHKERLLNLLAASLPDEIEKIIVVDNDCLFENPRWIAETEAALDKFAAVQPFERAEWLPDTDNAIPRLPSYSFACALRTHPRMFQNIQWRTLGSFHPGFAWGFRRDFFKQCGLPERLILGGGDGVLALSALGKLSGTNEFHLKFPSAPFRQYLAGVERAIYKAIGGKVGFVEGTVRHIYHGTWKDRKYAGRWEMLEWFDPNDLVVDPNGLLQWRGECPLERVIEKYFHSRKEDEKATTNQQHQ